MKSGASDPFADDDEGDEDADPDGDAAGDSSESDAAATASTTPETAAETTDATGTGRSGDRRELTGGSSDDGSPESADDGGSDGSADETDTTADDAGGISRDELPYVLRREKVKDERPEVHQLFVQQETHQRAVEAERDLQDRLDSNLSRTDAREAIYLAGMSHLDEAAAVLREWGYDL